MPTAVNSYGRVVDISGNTPAQTMALISDLLVNKAGLTIYDQVSDTQTIYKYQATAKSIPIYFGFIVTSSAITPTPFYKSWNATTHTGGLSLFSDESSYPVSTTTGQVYLFACPGCILFAKASGGVVYSENAWKIYFGIPYNFNPLPACLTTAAVAAASGNIVPVDNTTGFFPGMKVAIADSGSAGWDYTTIISVGVGTLTLTTNTIALSSGSYICVPPVFLHQRLQDGAGLRDLFCANCLSSSSVGTGSISGTSIGKFFSMPDTDGTTGKYSTGPINLNSTLFSNAYIDNNAVCCSQTGSFNNFLAYNTDGSPLSSGVATGGTTTTIVTSGLVADALVGKFVAVAGGTNVGVCRKANANDTTTITVDTAFPSVNNVSTQFVVADYIFRYGDYSMLQVLLREYW